MSLTNLKQLKVEIRENAQLSDYTTFRLGGQCPCIVNCRTPEKLINVIKALVKQGTEYILIGGGSNLLVSDRGVDCAVIRYVSDEPLIDRGGQEVTVSGSTDLDSLALYAAEHGLEGLNCTTGIPGTVGGAVVGNAGAFGRQVGDVLKTAKLMTSNGDVKDVSAESLGFSYRYSNLKDSGDIVVTACFQLRDGNKEQLLSERAEILATRKARHPDLKENPCAGSFFRNIEPTSKAGKRQAAGWFLDAAGGKQLGYGGAKIFEKHANIIIKSDQCTSQDVYELSQKMQRIVKDKFDLELIREVRLVGQFGGNKGGNGSMIW